MRICIGVLIFLLTAPALAELPAGPGEWPQWRGPQRSGVSQEEGLLKQWPEEGPKVVWQIDSVGKGYSSIAVKAGKIYTQGDLHGVEHIICLDASDGSRLWAVQPEPAVKRLEERVARELKRLDQNGNGLIDELEALVGFGLDFNKFDQPVEGDSKKLAVARGERLFEALDKNQDNKLTAEETPGTLHEEFPRIDQQDRQADAAELARTRAAAMTKSLDEDGDQKISQREARDSTLRRSFRRADQRDPATGKPDGQLTEAELESYFARQEPGRDGALTKQELCEYYAQKFQGDGVLTIDELQAYYGGYRNGQGDGPRGTPTIDGDLLYAVGGNGDVSCLRAATGQGVWFANLVDDFGGGRPGWGYCESPLIDGDKVIVTPGGKKGAVVALDKRSGDLIWQSDGVTERAHYASPVSANVRGVHEIVQFARDSVFGLDAETGKLLWKYGEANNGTANVCTPIVSDNHVFASSAYGTGGGLAEIKGHGDSQKAEEVYFERRMANHHGGIVKVGDHLYGFGSGGLICMNFLDGEIAWRARSVGKGSLVVADGMLYLLGEGHEVALAEATPEEYRERGRFSIANLGRRSWAHPVVAGGRLYIRNQQTLTAYDVRP